MAKAIGIQSWTAQLVVLGAAISAGACGGSTDADANGSGGNASASGGSNSAGGGAAASGGSGSDDACSALLDDDGQHLEINIRNERSTPIYIGPREPTCGSQPAFSLADGDGSPLTTHLGYCGATCEQEMAGGVGCLAVCLAPTLIRIDPNDAYSTTWAARTVELETLPEACAPESFAEQCPRMDAIEPGDFIFSASAGTELRCGDDPCEDCDPAENNPCPSELVVAGDELEATAAVELDGSYGIYAEGEEPTHDYPVGANYPVEIVFTE